MSTTLSCPRCQKQIDPHAADGLCAECLMRQAILGADNQGADLESLSPTEDQSQLLERFRPPSPSELAAAFPNLEIYQLVGQGGMGAVYRARQKSLDRVVALKILPTQLSSDPAFAERFTREAQAMAKLNHPSIVASYEVGQQDGYYYLMMEYVDGVNLRQAIADGVIEPKQALTIVEQVCEALQYAHDEGIVHRDIKPENILIDRKGRVKIADFGLAKMLRRTPVQLTLTRTNQIMGTLHYMAPEQVERPFEVDHRADIFSLGVVFYELMTGHLPLGRFELPSESGGYDARLDDVVMKALEREPARRYQYADEVKTDVSRISLQKPPRNPATVGAGKSPHPSALQANDASELQYFRLKRITDPLAFTLKFVACVPVFVFLLFSVFNVGGINGATYGRLINGEQAVADSGLVKIAVVVMSLIVVQICAVVAAGWHLGELRNYERTKRSLYWALIPISPLWVIAAPLLLLALYLISQTESVAAFAVGNRLNNERRSGRRPKSTFEAKHSLGAAAVFAFLLGIAVLLAIGIVAFASYQSLQRNDYQDGDMAVPIASDPEPQVEALTYRIVDQLRLEQGQVANTVFADMAQIIEARIRAFNLELQHIPIEVRYDGGGSFEISFLNGGQYGPQISRRLGEFGVLSVGRLPDSEEDAELIRAAQIQTSVEIRLDSKVVRWVDIRPGFEEELEGRLGQGSKLLRTYDGRRQLLVRGTVLAVKSDEVLDASLVASDNENPDENHEPFVCQVDLAEGVPTRWSKWLGSEGEIEESVDLIMLLDDRVVAGEIRKHRRGSIDLEDSYAHVLRFEGTYSQDDAMDLGAIVSHAALPSRLEPDNVAEPRVP